MELGFLTVIDTEKEKSMDLGVAWPFGKLQEGECVIKESLKSEYGGLEIGDIVYLDYYDYPTFEAVGALYNITA
jgi:hypothetical protein